MTHTEYLAEIAEKMGVDVENLPDKLISTYLEEISENVGKGGGNSSGGGSVQPDWNQNDASQPDYVKNRPFYTEKLVLLECADLAFTNDGMLIGVAESPNLANGFMFGEAYEVNWDGTVYTCIADELDGISIIGNIGLLSTGVDSGEPFIIMGHDGACQIMDIPGSMSGITEATHSVTIIGNVVKKIESKYLQTSDWNAGPGEDGYIVNKPFGIDDVYTYTGECPDLASETTITIGNNVYWRIGDPLTQYVNENSAWLAFSEKLTQVSDGSVSGSSTEMDNYMWTQRIMNNANHSRDSFFGVQRMSDRTIFINVNDDGITYDGVAVPIGLWALAETNEGTVVQYVSELKIFKVKTMPDYYIEPTPKPCIYLQSSTEGSRKWFRVTVDDSGTLTATETSIIGVVQYK